MFPAQYFQMPQDELEHLRAILAHAHEKPRKAIDMRALVQRITKGFFKTPKKVILERVKNDPPKREVA